MEYADVRIIIMREYKSHIRKVQFMPAAITHYLFGRDVYESIHEIVGTTRDETDAFLLGNQGPDPLFYGAINLPTMKVATFGSTMHSENTVELIEAFRQALDAIPKTKGTEAHGEDEVLAASAYDIARAYIMGFICHYLLDSHMHPLVYAQQWELCDAGVPGLDRTDANEVHALIESELDELALTAKLDESIKTFNPGKKILCAQDHVLKVIGQLYSKVARDVYDYSLSPAAYGECVRAYRLVLRSLWSPSGTKRKLFSSAERLFRPHSFLGAMSHRNQKIYTSQFDNSEHDMWAHPDTGIKVRSSFWDIYNDTLTDAYVYACEYAATPDVHNFALRVTQGFNFKGNVVRAIILSAETI